MGLKKSKKAPVTPAINPGQVIADQERVNRVNVSTPFGSQQYVTGPDGRQVLQTTLTPEMQALFQQQMARAGSNSPGYALPGGHGDALAGAMQRIKQRYAMPGVDGVAGGQGSVSGGGMQADAPASAVPPPPAAPVAQGLPSDNLASVRANAGGRNEGFQDFCVVAGAYLSDGSLSEDAAVGDWHQTHLPGDGFADHPVRAVGAPVLQPCVMLSTRSGAQLACSESTPFNLVNATADLKDGEWKRAPDMLGELVFVETPAGRIEDEVIHVQAIGEKFVIPLDFGGRSFAAGMKPWLRIYSHNVKKRDDAGDQLRALGSKLDGMAAASYGSQVSDHSAPTNFGIPLATSGEQGTYTTGGKIGAGLGAATGMPGVGTGLPGGQNPMAGFNLPSSLAWDANPEGGWAGGNVVPRSGLNFGQKLTEFILPGRQFDKTTHEFKGAGSVLRGVGQSLTGIPMATGYDIYRALRDRSKTKDTP